MNNRVLTIDNVRLSFPVYQGAVHVLNAVSLHIDRGEIVGVVGESGSGKSVTAMLAMRLLPPGSYRIHSGQVTLMGDDILGATEKEMRDIRGRKVAMIFQEPMTALNPVLTVGRQIDEVLQTHTDLGAAQRHARVLDALAQVHLPDIARVYDAYPHQLSGGQRQRIMIAMALVLEPRLLIADEPTTALDVTTQQQILKLIRELQQKHGTAVLFITHDMGVVVDIADRVCVMRKGNIVEAGPLRQVLSQPREDYTKALLAAVPSLAPRPVRKAISAQVVLDVVELGKIYPPKGGTLCWFGKGRKGTRALHDVTFSLKRGRTLGIVGESGSGKSTMARCVMRLLTPDEGAIRITGNDISELSPAGLKPHRKRIQMIFQDPNRSLNPRISIGKSLVEGPMNHGASFALAWAKGQKLLELVGLPADAIDRYPHQFSGGQRQRIAIARALAMEPDVIVADEAVSALDVSVQAQVLQLLNDIQQRLGVAILFITHDLRVAAQLCDDVLVMRYGEVIEYGAAAEVLASPQHPYTQQLMDAVPGKSWDFAAGRGSDCGI